MAKTEHENLKLDRRTLLRASVGGLVGFVTPPVLAANEQGPSAEHRSLSFHHLHTGEHLSVSYWRDGRYDAPALSEIDNLLRDFRTGESIGMDVQLLEVLHRLRTKLETDQPFHVISAYRSPRTNAQLAGKSSGVAKRSYHMLGMAIDVRLPGRRLQDVRQAALTLRLGGVGYYGRSNFIHLDTGRVRYW